MEFAWASPDYIMDRLTPGQIRELYDSLIKEKKARAEALGNLGNGGHDRPNVTVLEARTVEENRKAIETLQKGVAGR